MRLDRPLSDGRTPLVSAVMGIVWAVMFAAALGYVARFGSPVPIGDDMGVVGRLGQPDPITAKWLWSQYVVHRLPLPRLLYVGIIAVTHDVRAVMFVNVCLLSAVALAMIAAARHLRGRASYADAFFPLVWLSWGNAKNLLSPFSFTFVLPTVLSCAILLVILRARQPLGWRPALGVGLALLSLPLCGGPGVTQAPALALGLILAGVFSLRSGDRGRRRGGLAMLLFGVATVVLVAAYLVGLELPGGGNADIASILATVPKFVTLSVGPAASTLWPTSGVLVLGSLVVTAVILVRALRRDATERLRVAAVLTVFAALLCMALAIGLKARHADSGFSLRYITLPAPFLCAAYLTWCKYAPRRLGAVLCSLWCLLLLAATPDDVERGLVRGREHSQAMERLSADARAGATIEELAARHWEGLFPTEERFRLMLLEVRRAGFAPFRRE